MLPVYRIPYSHKTKQGNSTQAALLLGMSDQILCLVFS